MNYYISDLHIGCTNRYENRTLDYDEVLVQNWNAVVNNNDTVYILGDIGKLGSNAQNEYVCSVISRLKGKRILITGNHDIKGLKDNRVKQLFTEICDYKMIVDNFDGNNKAVVMSHYPILFWDKQHDGAIHLYGHLHETDEYSVYQKCLEYVNEYFKDREMKGYKDCPQCKAYNVGCMLDYMDYTPRTLKHIMLNCG